jgi:hypothetical protein
MFAVLAKILGSKDVIQQGMSLIDDMVVTTEEEVAAKSKARVDLLAAYQPFKLAQRYIALMFTGMFLFIMANGVVGALYGVIDMANVEAAKDFASSMWLGEIMLGIVGFYFGGGLASSIKERK